MPKKRIFLAVLAVAAVFLPAFFALAFTGPTQSPPNGSGVLTVDSNGNFGLLPSGSTATPEQGGFGKVFTVASSTNPGFSMLNTTAGSRYTWYEDNGGKLNLWYNTPTVGYSRLTVSPAGYLGVNTSSPATNLDVNGNAQSSIYYDRDNTNYYLDLAANTLPYSALFSGSVGIGTTNPSAKLEIDSSDATAYSATAQGITPVGSDILVLSNPNASANFSSLYFGAGSSGSGVGRIAVLTSGGGVGTMVFQLRDGSGGDGYTPEKMRISYNGNVGIGTTSPGAKLTVAGAGQFTSFSNPSSGLGVEIGHDGVEGILQSYNRTSPGWSPLWINGSNVILQNSSGGKVGIGTTNPVTELTTYGQGDNLTVQSGSDNTGVRHSIVFQGGATNVEARIMSGNYGSYNGGLDFQVASHSVASTTTNSALFILYNGDVGIGTTNPLTAGLVVSTNVGGAAIDVTNNRIINLGTPVNANDAATKGYVDSAYVPGGSAGNVGGTGTSGYVPKWTSTSTIANSLIYDNGTNVGIGTTNPGQKLEVEGSVLGRAAATGNTWGYYLNSTAGVSVAKFEVAGSDTNHAVTLGAISNNPLYFITANSTRVTIYNTGNVGIGTSTPTTAGLVVTTNVSTVGIDVNNNRIQNVGTPINNNDAATKSYVDSSVTGGGASGNLSTLTVSGTTTLATVNGNVGIKMTNPLYPLDVNGNIRIASNAAIYSGYNNNYILKDHGNGNVTLSAAGGDLYLGYQNTSHVRLTQSLFDNNGTNQIINANGFIYQQNSSVSNYFAGKVGVGTSTPGTNLDVVGNINASIYYDRDNTNYYADLAGNTMPYAISAGGEIIVTDNTQSTPNVLFSAGYSPGSPTNRQINFAQILNASTGNQYLFLNGTLGSTSVVGTPTCTSIYASCFGIESNDNNLNLITAAAGTNAAVIRALSINSSGGATFNGSNVTLSSATQLVINSTSSSAIQMNQGSITGVYKLSVNTVDPVYRINGVNYATYAPDIIGIKTEVFGKANLTKSNLVNSPYVYTIDFNSVVKGSDLWLFWQTINEGKDMKDISVYLTPDFAGEAWYTLEPTNKEIVIYAIPNTKYQISNTNYEVSYHLVAPRYDSEKWGNYAPATETGTTLQAR